MQKDLSNRIHSLTPEERSFVPDGQTEPVKYNVLVLGLRSHTGDALSIDLKVSKDKLNQLVLAAPKKEDLFES